jgi:hypothetical protein
MLAPGRLIIYLHRHYGQECGLDGFPLRVEIRGPFRLFPGRTSARRSVCKSSRRRRSRAAYRPHQRELQEEALNPSSIHVKHAGVALRNHIGVPVFAFHKHIVVSINRRGINTPVLRKY